MPRFDHAVKSLVDSKTDFFQFFVFARMRISTLFHFISDLLNPNLFITSSTLFVAILLAVPNIVFSNDISETLKNAPPKQSASLALKPIKVMVNWNHQFQFAGFYAAIAKGFYQEKGLAVEILDWQPGYNDFEHLLNGDIDFSVAQNDSLLELANGAPYKLVMANFQYSPLVLLSHKPIKNLSELSGAKVMHNGSLQIRTLLQKAYLKTGIFPEVQASSGNLQDFIDKKVDFYGAFNTNEPFILQRNNIPYSVIDPKVYGVQSYDGLVITRAEFATNQPQVVLNFREATIQGWSYALNHPEEIVDYIIEHYKTHKTREDMLNEAQIMIQYVEPAPGMIGQIDINKLEAVLSDAKKYLQSNQKPISEQFLKDFIYSNKPDFLSPQETAFLEKNPVITLGNASDWPPFDYVEDGVYKGLASDYLQLIASKLGIEFRPKNLLWPDVSNLIEQDKPIVFPALMKSTFRSQHLYFTAPYIHLPFVLASYRKDGFINDFGRLMGHTVSVINKSWAHDYFRENYPNITLFLVDTTKQGLQSVLERKSLVYAGNLGAINYALKHEGYTDFNIVGRAEQSYQVSMAVSKAYPELFSIIQKTLSQITPVERQHLYEKWFPITMVNEFDSQQFWQVTVFLLSIIIVISLLLAVVLKRQSYINSIYELSLATTIDLKTLRISSVSNSFCELSGYSRRELINKNYLKLSKNKIPQKQIQQIKDLLASGKTWKGDFPGIRKNGEEYWVALTMTPKKNFFNKVNQVVITRYDITDRKRVEQVSITDELTGLLNRRKFNEALPLEINRAHREKANLGLIMLDIDFFKSVNDEYGHDVGDEVLIEIATSLNSYFHRATDMIFRIGGEEFIVITHFENLRALEVHINNLLIYVRSLGIENRQAPLKVVTLSAGAILCYPDHKMNAKDLMKQTDQLLYKSKNSGRNTFHSAVITRNE